MKVRLLRLSFNLFSFILFKDFQAGRLKTGPSLSLILWKTFSRDQTGKREP